MHLILTLKLYENIIIDSTTSVGMEPMSISKNLCNFKIIFFIRLNWEKTPVIQYHFDPNQRYLIHKIITWNKISDFKFKVHKTG